MRKIKDDSNIGSNIADLMSGLMIIFLFISVSYMIEVSKEKDSMKKIAGKFQVVKYSIYTELLEEFKDELKIWNAEIDKETLSVRFKEPDVFFKTGEKDLNDNFKKILDDFFPRYITVLSKKEFKSEIEEIRIEGHTSSEWAGWSTPLESYFKNMELSQARTRSVLEYVMKLNSMKKYRTFLIEKVTANGLSYSQRVIENGKENLKKSRRVEFKIRTTAEKHIDEILGEKNEIN